MKFVHLKTIDNKELWLNLEQVCAFSYENENSICLIELSGGEPQQITRDEFAKIEPFLGKKRAKNKRKN